MNRKVTVVGGAGNVGAAVARCIADKELADVVIVDIADQKAAGVALDMLESCPITGSDSRVIGGSDYAQTANSDVVVITSASRAAGMSRDDPLNVNFGIMKAVTEQVVSTRPIASSSRSRTRSTRCAGGLSAERLPAERVVGMAGVPRLGTHADLHRHGAEVSPGERSRVRAGGTGTPWCRSSY